MKKTFENYTVLTGNHGRRGSLWKGEDHLLAVEGRGVIFPFSEHYRRVDYKNIQAITHVLTKRYWIILFALLIPMLLLAGGAALALSREKAPIAITLGVIFLPFLGMLAWHMALGKTCVCTLQTAVQNMRLKPLTRINKARQVMSDIETLCLLHQGPMPTEFSSTVTPQPDYHIPGTKPFWQGSAWVIAAGVSLVILGAGLILCGAVIVSELWSAQYNVLYIDSFLCAMAFICSIAGLAKATKHQTPDGLIPTLWASLVLEVMGGGAFYILIMIDNITRPKKFGGGYSSDLRRLLSQSPLQELTVGCIIIGLGCVFAVPGLNLMFYGFHRVAPHPKPSKSPSVPPAL